MQCKTRIQHSFHKGGYRSTAVRYRVALRDAGVLADCTLCEWALDVLPLDDDVLTLVGVERGTLASSQCV